MSMETYQKFMESIGEITKYLKDYNAEPRVISKKNITVHKEAQNAIRQLHSIRHFLRTEILKDEYHESMRQK